MDYENRLPPEDINTSRTHPLRQFLQLVIAALVLVVLLVILLRLAGGLIARQIPFSLEQALVERIELPIGDADTHPDMTRYLNALAERVSAHMPLPEGMRVQVHYDSEPVFNAFATVGGQLLFYRGLLERMPNENTLAMVMAHEIAHVMHRDPVASLGGGLASAIALLGLTGQAGTGMAGELLTQAGLLTGVQFTRSMEIEADDAALAALNGLYGHVGGASELFALFRQARGASDQARARWLERFVSTHPLDEDRMQHSLQRALAARWPTEGMLTPLPDEFHQWLAAP